MNVRKVTNDYRAQHWMSVIKQCRESGLTIRAWCKEQGVNEKGYYYWQRKFREAACIELERSQESAAIQSDLIKYEPLPAGWTQLAPTEHQDSSLTIEVGGCRVIVNSDTDPALLSQTLRTLKTL